MRIHPRQKVHRFMHHRFTFDSAVHTFLETEFLVTGPFVRVSSLKYDIFSYLREGLNASRRQAWGFHSFSTFWIPGYPVRLGYMLVARFYLSITSAQQKNMKPSEYSSLSIIYYHINSYYSIIFLSPKDYPPVIKHSNGESAIYRWVSHLETSI